MENRLKERLTGAVIIVALIVLLVPEMFRGPHTPSASTTSSGAEGPPLRTYTIDLSNNATHKAPLQTGGPEAAPAASAEGNGAAATTPPAVIAANAPASAPTNPPTAASAPPPPAAAPESHKSAPVMHANPAPAPSSPPAAPLHATVHAPENAGSSWSVQLGLFAKRENAERLMHAAQDKGFSVSVSGADAKGLFHVHVTPLADRAAAQAVSARLKADGFAAAVVAPQ